MCLCACGVCVVVVVVFVGMRWVARGQRVVGGGVGSVKTLQRTHAVDSCLPPTSSPFPILSSLASPSCRHARHPFSLHTSALVVVVMEFSKGGGGQLSDICSAEMRGRRAPGIGGCRVRGVGTRLAGYSRGGGSGSRRWMALTENRLLKQHDISWNESAHTHANTHSWQRTAVYAFLCAHWHSVLFLLLCLLALLDYFSPRTSGFLKAAMSSTEMPFKGVFICSLQTWTVSARHRGSFVLPITFPAAESLPSLPVFSSFILHLFRFPETKPR
ncbi:hypothetical protein Q8A73_004173 [Channa argus]|nr:hypothetical protein Q8A73_004173 [Channa argus]